MEKMEDGVQGTAVSLPCQSASSLRRLIAALPDILYVLDGEGRFAFLNDSVAMLGYSPRELRGRHFTEIIHPDDRDLVSRDTVIAKIRQAGSFPDTAPKLFDERRSGARMTRDLQVRILKGGGGEIFGSVNAYGEALADPGLLDLFECSGPVTIGVIRDVTPSVLYQRGLEENLAAKATLLKELHHRVRNNLQVVASLVHLERGEGEELDELTAQIRAIAMVHEALSETEDLVDADVGEYFRSLMALLVETYGAVGSPVSLEVSVEEGLRLEGEALSSLALVCVGFVHHAYAEAFPGERRGRIDVGFTPIPAGWELSLKEDGLDCSEVYRKSPDCEIAEALAGQLGGTLDIEGGGGMGLRLRFPIKRERRS